MSQWPVYDPNDGSSQQEPSREPLNGGPPGAPGPSRGGRLEQRRLGPRYHPVPEPGRRSLGVTIALVAGIVGAALALILVVLLMVAPLL